MNSKFKKLFIILMIMLLVCSLVMALAACNNDEDTDEDDDDDNTETEEYIISNGNFADTTTDDKEYPLTPEDWTGAVGSTSSTYGTPSGSDNLIAGVISVDETLYNQNKSKWGDLDNPAKNSDADDNILMIYNKVLTVYKYTNTFTIEAGKYYKVSIPVKTQLQEGSGAYIYLTSGAYAAFEKIDTAGAWSIYTVYLEASLIEKSSITITIAFGYGDNDDGNMAKGYAFFDNLFAEETTAAEYASHGLTSTNQRYSMRVPDSRMEYATGTSYPKTAYGYTKKTGTGAGGSAPYGSSDVSKGIVSTATADWVTDNGTNPGNAVEGFGNNILMIRNKTATASGYAGNNEIRFAISGYYELSVDVWVELDAAMTDLDNKGATLALTGADDFKIEYIKTSGAWVTYSFFIEANQVRNKDFTLEMWLGKGGADDTATLTKGIAFFDNVVLTEITEATYLDELDNYENDPSYKNFAGSLVSTNPNLIDNYNLEDIDLTSGLPTGWEEETTSPDVLVNEGDVEYASISAVDIASTEWTAELQAKYLGLSSNPLAPYSTMAPVFVINNNIPTVSGMGLADNLTINPNLHYRMAIWVKTVDIDESLGLTVKLVSGTGDDLETLSTFSAINTVEYEDEYTNDYLELVFLIQGNELIGNNVRVLIELGSGDAYTPAKYVEGYALIANVNMEEITYDEYSDTSTSTYIKKYSFTDSDSALSNGNFTSMDLSETTLDAQGALTDKPGVPADWTASSKTEDNVTSGVINTENEDLLDALGIDGVFDTNMSLWTLPYGPDFGAPNVLMIQANKTSDDEEYEGTIDPFGYTSDSFTMSANSYYIIKAYVKTVVDPTDGDASASIYLSPTTNVNSKNFLDIQTGGNWEEYIFLVSTGRESVSAQVELYLGNQDGDEVSGTVYFDSISYTSIEEDAFNTLSTDLSADDNVNILSYQIDSFDSFTEKSSGLETPKSWTGTLGSSSLSSDSEDIEYGVLNKISAELTDMGVQDDEGNIIEASKIDSAFLDKIFDTTLADTVIGGNVLMINNKIPNAYAYKTSSSETLTKELYYEVSVWVFTYYLSEGKSARVMLSVGEDTFSFKDVNTSTYVDGVETAGTWTKYSYYIKAAESANTSSVYLTLGLGKYLASDTDGALLVNGYAFFDNVFIDEIDEAAFNAKNELFTAARAEGASDEAKAFLNTNSVIIVDEPESSSESDPTDEEEEEETETDSEFPWLLVSTTVIGGVIVIAVLVIIFRKVYPKIAARRKLKFKKSSYDRNTSKDKDAAKSKRYDKYKE